MTETKLKVGDRIAETTPSGSTRRWTVTAVDVEPKYRHGYEGRWVEMKADAPSRQRSVMREADVLSVRWMERLA